MKSFLMSGALVVILAASMATAHAEPLPPAVIAIIDYRFLEQKSDAALDMIGQVNAYRDAYQTEVSASEEALRAEVQELERQRTILAPEVFKDKRRAFEEKTQAVQQKVLERNRRFDHALSMARNEILRTVLVIVTEVAEDRKFNIVLDSSQALFVANSLDITQVVMEELNKRLSTVTVAVPTDQ
jgi:Skp family chaperone for outer membrane proteins